MGTIRRRLFLAGDLPADWLQGFRQAGELLRVADPDARITQPGNEHLTWVFLGELEEDLADAAVQAVASVFAEWLEEGREVQELRFAFERWTAQRRQGGLALVRADLQVNSAHAEAVRQMTEAIAQAGVKLQRRAWLPHVTLARDVGPMGDLPVLGSGRLESVTLYESQFTARGMEYTRLLSWPDAPKGDA